MKIRNLAAALLLVSTVQAQTQQPVNIAEAVSSGAREQAFILLDQGADANALLADHSTALMHAAYFDDAELVRALLDAGADPNIRNNYGAFALSEASQNGNAEIVKMLLEHGADANMGNLEGETALMVAARSGALAAAELLLKAGANPDAREGWGGQTALMWAAAQSQPAMIRLLARYKADINLQGTARLWDRRIMNEPRPKDMNKGGFSALMYAARQGCTDCIAELARAGVDLNATDPDRVSALNMALINLHFATALALIDAGADINQWDLFGRGPLFNAIDLNTLPAGGRPDIPSEDPVKGLDVAKVLLEKGAIPNMQLRMRPPYRNVPFDRGADNPISEGATPLIRAARGHDVPAIRLLVSHGALIDLPNDRGQTPLLVAAGTDWSAGATRGRFVTEDSSIAALSALLELGADINAVTGDPAKRPSAASSESARGEAVERASRGFGQVSNQNALHGAARLGWMKVAQFLIDNGITQELKDSQGRTPLDMAMGRYPPGYNAPPTEPNLRMAQFLQESCMKSQDCQVDDPIDFTNLSRLQ
jgi:ankyrin repeat protein